MRETMAKVPPMADDSDRALVPREPSTPATVAGPGSRQLDAFEQRYMVGGAQVLAIHRGRPGLGYHALIAFAAVAIALKAATVASAGIGLVLLALAWITFAIMRVTVTPSHLDVKYGPFGPHIPIAAITAIEATRYHWSSWGGWGIRRKLGTGEVLYAMPGDGGNAIRVAWTDAKGHTHRAVVGVRTPSEIVEAVEAVRARARAVATGEEATRPQLGPAAPDRTAGS